MFSQDITDIFFYTGPKDTPIGNIFQLGNQNSLLLIMALSYRREIE